MRSTLRKPLGALVVAAAVPLTLLGCAKDEPTVTAETSTTVGTVAVNSGAEIDITSTAGQFAFDPSTKEVKVNEAVTWKNTDTTKHTVTADKDQPVDFKSPTMIQGTEFVQTFATPGTYTYYCSIHGREKMSGSITVVP